MSAVAHLALVGTLPCSVCVLMGMGNSPASVHHCFDTAHRDDFLTIPLCWEHHQGGTGFHGLGEREFNRRYKTDELHLLAWTYRNLRGRREWQK